MEDLRKQKDITDTIIYFLSEWSVWCILDKYKDLELILLKGHLYLDVTLTTVILGNKVSNASDLSFFRKTKMLESIEVKDAKRKEVIICALGQINNLRNMLAHEPNFDLDDSAFNSWVDYVLSNLKGQKFGNYTFRTKKVHAFSVLTINILESFKVKKKCT